MSERLDQLKRQKKLLEEHLRWLDSEIVRENGQTMAESTPETAAPVSPESIASLPQAENHTNFPAAAARTTRDDDAEALSDQLISQYGHVSSRREMDPRLSLVLFFGGVLGFLSLVVFLVYWFGYR